jgi:hypothetical protein
MDISKMVGWGGVGGWVGGDIELTRTPLFKKIVLFKIFR